MSGLDLNPLDVFAFVFYLTAICGIGLYHNRKRKTVAADYFLAGRSLPWYVVGSSYIAANISTEHFIGLVGAAFIYGLCVATGEWSSVIAFTFLIWLYIPFLMKSRVYTAPEFLEKRFNRTMRTSFAVVTLGLNIFGFLGPILYGGGLVLYSLLGININLAIILIAFVAGFWAIWGGLKTIALIDVFTIVIMIAGGLTVTLLGFYHLGDGEGIYKGFERTLIANQGIPRFAADFIKESVPYILKGDSPGAYYDRLSVIQPLNHYAVPWTHWVLSFFYIGLWYTVINQHMVQKVLAAKDIYHARMGMILASLLKLLLPLIVVFPGLIFFAMNPLLTQKTAPSEAQLELIEELGLSESLEAPSHVLSPSRATLIIEMTEGAEVVSAARQAELGVLGEEEALAAQAALSELRFDFASKWSNQAYIELVREVVPGFWVGLLLAALFGSVQSTLSSVINSTSTVFTMDLYRVFFRPGASEREEVRVGRITGAVVLLLAIICAIVLAEVSRVNLFVYIQALFVFFAPPFSAVFLVGSLWRRVSGHDAVLATAGSMVFGLALKFTEFVFPDHLPDSLRPFANQGAAIWLVAVIILLILARFSRAPDKAQTSGDLIVRMSSWRLHNPSASDPWYLSVFFWWVFCVLLLVFLVVVFSLLL